MSLYAAILTMKIIVTNSASEEMLVNDVKSQMKVIFVVSFTRDLFVTVTANNLMKIRHYVELKMSARENI